MRALALLLSAVCLVELLIAFERLPIRLDMPTLNAPRFAIPRLPMPNIELGDQLDRAGDAARAMAWPKTVTVAAPEDIELRGAFETSVSESGPRRAVFEDARVAVDSETWRTEPVRIAAGRDVFVDGVTFARELRADGDAQIELRRIVPDTDKDQAETPASPLCGGDPPGLIALLHRPASVDLILMREGAVVGDGGTRRDVCGVWRFAR